ncbi:MAG: serine--tRNA ligase [Bacteroidota bacterium]
MLQLTTIRQETETIVERLKLRGIDAKDAIHDLLSADESNRRLRFELEQNQAKANQLAGEIGQLYKSGQRDLADHKKAESSNLKELIKNQEEELTLSDNRVRDLLVSLPNAPQIDVPAGKDAEDNQTVLEWGEHPQLHAEAKPHWELASELGIIDFELGVKITGAGFPVYKGKGAILQRALIQFFLNEAGKEGYVEMQVPHLVNADSGYGTGQLPDKEGQMYHAGLDDLYLIPTAEVPVTNLYRNTLLDHSQLPIKNTAYTPCFRREAGSYGAHVRGLNRLHQFDKVEIVQIVKPQDSNRTLELMQNYVQGLLQKLGLPYRLLLLCGGDMGFTSAKTYDLEVWSAAQERWLECSSVSNFETFQTNRLKCRFRNEEGKTELAHSLNGSALALPRIVAALLENNQDEKGIRIPDVLVPYTGFDRIDR